MPQPSIDDLLAMDTDEEKIDIGDEEVTELLNNSSDTDTDSSDSESSSSSSSSSSSDSNESTEVNNFVLDEELDYEPVEDDDLIVNVAPEDMFESCEEEVENSQAKSDLVSVDLISKDEMKNSQNFSNEKSIMKKVEETPYTLNVHNSTNPKMLKTAQPLIETSQSSVRAYDTPSSFTPNYGLLTTISCKAILSLPVSKRIKERLSSSSATMISWHSAHLMKLSKVGLDLPMAMYNWHRLHWLKARTNLSSRFKKRQKSTNLLINMENEINSPETEGSGGLSDRFGKLKVKSTISETSRKRKKDELPVQMKNKILKKLAHNNGDFPPLKRQKLEEIY